MFDVFWVLLSCHNGGGGVFLTRHSGSLAVFLVSGVVEWDFHRWCSFYKNITLAIQRNACVTICNTRVG